MSYDSDSSDSDNERNSRYYSYNQPFSYNKNIIQQQMQQQQMQQQQMQQQQMQQQQMRQQQMRQQQMQQQQMQQQQMQQQRMKQQQMQQRQKKHQQIHHFYQTPQQMPQMFQIPQMTQKQKKQQRHKQVKQKKTQKQFQNIGNLQIKKNQNQNKLIKSLKIPKQLTILNETNFSNKKDLISNKIKVNSIGQKFIELNDDSLNIYIKEKSNYLYTIGIHEAGGGGDCLFLSLAAGIKQAYDKKIENRLFTDSQLRGLVGQHIQKMSDDEFETLLTIFTANEEANDWYDRWLPSQNRSKHQLIRQITESGNNHWGTDVDINFISQELNICIIIFNSKDKILCLGNISQKKFRYYILIYNIDQIHYQLAGLKNKSGEYESVFTNETMPYFLKQAYLEICRNPI